MTAPVLSLDSDMLGVNNVCNSYVATDPGPEAAAILRTSDVSERKVSAKVAIAEEVSRFIINGSLATCLRL